MALLRGGKWDEGLVYLPVQVAVNGDLSSYDSCVICCV